MHRFSRLEMLVGEAGLSRLQRAKVAVFGIGGVGSYTAEALARSGIGQLLLVDHDTVSLTNLNRQIHALEGTIGQPKVDLMAERIRQINPDCQVIPRRAFLQEQNWQALLPADLSYVVDAIDTVSGKLLLVEKCRDLSIPIICSMGAGNKLDPTRLTVVDISETHTDPLARVMRRELRQRGIERGVKVVYSSEPPITPDAAVVERLRTAGDIPVHRRLVPGSSAFVPATAGLIAASVVVRDLLG